jgi:hypothetical protein
VTSLRRRIIAGDDWRPTRLHDEKGNLIQGSEWCYPPRAAVVCLKRVLFDKVDEVSWWTFGWMRRVERIVRPDMAVIEFGSGNSTLWLAGRVAALTSIEHHLDWHGFVAGKLTERGAGHVDYQCATRRATPIVRCLRMPALTWQLSMANNAAPACAMCGQR